jgi:hypothetical protein
MNDDPTQARVFTPDEAATYAAAGAGSPTMIKLPAGLARDIAENLQAFATYHEGVAAGCTTDHGREAASQIAKALRSYAGGLLGAAQP